MGLRVVKGGLADSIQDAGRFGYQHLGVNPGGVMDAVAMQIANMLVGNKKDEAVIELNFPPSAFVGEKRLLMALSGADFSATLNGKQITPNQAFVLNEGDELAFGERKKGAYAYLAVRGGWAVTPWLGSKSTNLKCKTGGHEGRFLKKHDVLIALDALEKNVDSGVLPWSIHVVALYREGNSTRIIKGAEFSWLTKKNQQLLPKQPFAIAEQSDRMGYRLKGVKLKNDKQEELISTATHCGTIQLLPDGSLIALLADHQTTGGYPRIAQIALADIPTFVQLKFSRRIQFTIISLEEAEDANALLNNDLLKLAIACRYKLKEWL
jgi:antagonist of KipI